MLRHSSRSIIFVLSRFVFQNCIEDGIVYRKSPFINTKYWVFRVVRSVLISGYIV